MDSTTDSGDGNTGIVGNEQRDLAAAPEPRSDAADVAREAAGGATETSTAEAGSAPQVILGDGAPRPRRRRRRRRRPGQAPGQTAATGGGEAAADADAGGDTGDDHTGGGDDTGDAATVSPATGEAATTGEEDGAQRPVLRLRNRRRRRRPPVLGLLPGPAAVGEAGVEGAIAAEGAAAAPRLPLAPGQRSFHAPRRQRRHAPLAGAPGETATGAVAAGDGDAAPPQGPGGEAGDRPPRSRNRRRRRGPPAGAVDTAAPGAAGGQQAPRRDGRQGPGDRQGGPRPAGAPATRGDARRGPGPRDRGGRGDRPPGRDRGDRRDGPPQRAERQLYSIDATVDRGFEDVEEDGETRRVHWTIVKRTAADQITRKPVSTSYVLQREGSDAEFPSLGAARTAVNKTIVHPEKLTLSRAEHAAAKK